MRGVRSKNRLLLYCVAILLTGLLAGCATTSETTTLQENLSILNQRQAALEKRIQSAEGAARRSSDLYAQMQVMQTELRDLNGKIEHVAHRLDQMERAQAEASTSRTQAQQPLTPPPGTVVMGETPPPASQPQSQPRAPAPPTRPAPGTYARTASPPPPPPIRGRSPEQAAFDRAVHLMQARKYGSARKEFRTFLSRFPQSDLEESALYYIGESYFAEKRYEDAIKAFQHVVDKYPKGGKTASALLKEGIGWQQIGENTMARIIYTQLVEHYPGTAQARAAAKKLKQM